MSKVTLLSLVTSIAVSGCAASVAPDTFEGTYRFRDLKEGGYFVVNSVPPNRWNVSGSPDGTKPVQLHPLSADQPMALASAQLVAEWFDTKSPRENIACISSSGRYNVPLICSIPINASYQVTQAMTPSKRLTASTGYLLVIPTAAGNIAVDLMRAK